MPTAPRGMPLPYRCTQDSLFEIKFWDDLKIDFRESDFLDHPRTPQAIRDASVRLVVSGTAPAPGTGAAEGGFTAVVRPGTAMSEVGRAVAAANPRARLVEVGAADLRRLCKWLGSTDENRKFNKVARCVGSGRGGPCLTQGKPTPHSSPIKSQVPSTSCSSPSATAPTHPTHTQQQQLYFSRISSDSPLFLYPR